MENGLDEMTQIDCKVESLLRNPDWIEKRLVDLHAVPEIPRA